MSLENYLSEVKPNHGELIDEDGLVKSEIFDVELDLFECEFDGGGNVQINTKDLSYITLDISILEKLIDLCCESESI